MGHAVYIYDIVHVIIDNIQFMMGVGGSDGAKLDRYYMQDVVRSQALCSTIAHITLRK